MANQVKRSANELRGKLRIAYETIMKKIDVSEQEALHKIISEIDNNFNEEYNENYAFIKKFQSQSVSCEFLLPPASSVVERVKLYRQLAKEPPTAKKSKKDAITK